MGRKLLPVLVAVLTVGAWAVPAHRSWAARELAGRVEAVSGTVTVERAGKLEALGAGASILVKDRIATGSKGPLEMVFVDGSRMRLGADSVSEISGYLFNSTKKIRDGLILLTAGKARFLVKDFPGFNDRRFRVQTPTAEVGSRDTDFIVAYFRQPPRDEVCRGGLTDALCLDRGLIVSNLDFPTRPVLLIGKMISQVCGQDLPTPPRFVTAAESAGIMSGLEANFLEKQ